MSGPAVHMARQVRPAQHHLRRRRPARPFGLAGDRLDARPFEARPPDADAVADRAAVRQHQEQKLVRRVDDDRAGPLGAGIIDLLAQELVGGPRLDFARRGRRQRGDDLARGRRRRGEACGAGAGSAGLPGQQEFDEAAAQSAARRLGSRRRTDSGDNETVRVAAAVPATPSARAERLKNAGTRKPETRRMTNSRRSVAPTRFKEPRRRRTRASIRENNRKRVASLERWLSESNELCLKNVDQSEFVRNSWPAPRRAARRAEHRLQRAGAAARRRKSRPARRRSPRRASPRRPAAPRPGA